MSTVLVDTNDLGKAEDVVSANFGRIRMAAQEPGAPTRSRMTHSFVGQRAWTQLTSVIP
jgi:hypothetical protein